MAALARRIPQKTTVALSLQSLRSFSSKLLVSGLSPLVNDEMLTTAFVDHGPLVDVKIVTEHGPPFGFVTFSHESHAEAAMSKMSNFVIHGRHLRIEMASDDQETSPSCDLPSSSSSSYIVIDMDPHANGECFTPTYSERNTGEGCRSSEDVSTSFLLSSTPASAADRCLEAISKDGGNNCRASKASSQLEVRETSSELCDQDVELSEMLVITESNSTSDAASAVPSDNSEEYDFRTFPDLKSSAYQNYSMPSEMLQRQKRPVLLKGVNLDLNIFGSMPSMESIPTSKGNPYDFGLKDVLGSFNSPLMAGAKPLGVFDVNISNDELKEGEESSSAQSLLQNDIFPESSFMITTEEIGFSCSTTSDAESGLGAGVNSETSEIIEDRGLRSSMNVGSMASMLLSAKPMNNDTVASTSSLSEEGYDFRTLPDLKSDAYINYELPSELLHGRKHHPFLKDRTTSRLLESEVNMKSIPPFRGVPYDFGLKGMLDMTSLSKAGSKPQGSFDVNVSFDDVKEQKTFPEPAHSEKMFLPFTEVQNNNIITA